MKNKPYPKYKDSGVEWLGEIPENWEFKRLRFLTKLNPSKKEISLAPENEISFVPMESVGEYGGIKLDSTKALDDIDSGYTYFANDDVIIAKITPCFENVKGALAKNLKNGVAFGTTELHVLRCLEKYDPRYLFYISISYPFRKIGESEMYGAGGQKRIPEDYLKDLQAPLSPIGEQKQIAIYLDKKTAQIDELINKKKKLIEKLDEKRTALITHAVTKGLDDTIKLKPSGIDWLGDIPEHWVVKRLRFITKLNPSKKETNLTSEDAVSFIPMESVGEYGGIKLDATKALDDVDAGYTYFANDDVVIAKITPCFENVKGALAKELMNGVAFGTTELHVLRCLDKYYPKYLFYISISYSFRKIGESEMYGAGGQKRIPEDYLKDFRAPLLPIEEQKRIADYLEKEINQIDNLKSKIQRAIEKLEEYRSSLITNAVTGKIDVRGVVDVK